MRGFLFAALAAATVGAACGGSGAPPPLESTPPLIAPEGGPEGSLIGPTIPPSDDPTTCAEAAASKSYVGCDYWPTVTANNVWSVFDFAVVVANAGNTVAQVTVTGPGGVNQSTTVQPGSLGKIYLPWIPSLKGPDADNCGVAMPVTASTVATGAAYHLVSSVPVMVTQFNALEYQGAGGPSGKSWASCPGNTDCAQATPPQPVGCFSFSNDSSLLLPSTALTGNARIVAYPGETFDVPAMGSMPATSTPLMASFIAITGVTDGTHVKVYLASTAPIVQGTGVTATPGGQELDLTLNAGDVAQLLTPLGDTYDLSGSLVQADQPVQVITGAPCDFVPENANACDHLEQSVFPAETLGKQYFVTVPTGPGGPLVGHVVRMVGNVDGTLLTYSPTKPGGCPTMLNAGQVVDCGIVDQDFEVTGTHEFVVASFQLGGSIVDPNGGLGDPSQSLFASVEQYRTKYVFLAPDDYSQNWADVVLPSDAELWMDGEEIIPGSPAIPVADGYSVSRIELSNVMAGAHVLEASAPVGLQVLGYGEYTSYQYPGGLDLKVIAPPPPPGATQ